MVDSCRRSFLVRAGLATASTSVATFVAPTVTAASNAAALSSRHPAAAPPTVTPSDLQSLVDRERNRIRDIMARQDIPGAAVSFLQDGHPIWAEGFGVTDRKSNHPVSDSTLFSVQSTSKNFTSTAIMMAVQRGLLRLDEPIGTYVPEFTVRSRFDSSPTSKMTLRLLLSHRAGFTHEAPVGNNYDPSFPDFEAHILSISRTWLRYQVGERYSYSNLGVDLAGYILQTVAKLPFAECLKAWLFDPLGMTDSTADTQTYVRRTDRALGHAKDHASVPLKLPLIPSGGVYTNAREMLTYLSFHLNKGNFAGKVLLDETLWNEMHSFSLGGNYSLGVSRQELRYGDTPLRMLNHNGGGFGFGCVCNYCPQAKLAWVAHFNRQAVGGYEFGDGLSQDLLARQYGARRPRLPAEDLAPIQLQPTQLDRFVGRYAGRLQNAEITMQDGKLGMQGGAGFTPLQFTSPDEMFVVAPNGDVTVSRYFPGRENEVAYVECSIGDYNLDYNDGPHDRPGPDKPEWERFVGTYQIEWWGQPSQQLKVYRRNGYLYLDETRMLLELEPGLFFTTDGEAVDFRHPVPTWRNIRLQRILS